MRRPPIGWLAALRNALGMSGADVANRMGLSRSAVYQAERNEVEGAITLNQLQKLAEAMGGRLVYAIVPEGSVDDLIRAQARLKAETRIRRVNIHMELERQGLSKEQLELRIRDLANELMRDRSTNFWKNE